ncbi:MAG: VWA domain-containing protein [Bryobacterales bacterium]|nr:VWA domain-containing protein [Bryobacterales bacterium]
MFMRMADFVEQERAAATAFMAMFVVLVAVGGGAFIIDHVALVDQRDTLKEASNAAAIATTLEMRRVLTDNPGISDEDLKAALEPLARGYIIANLQHLSGDRYQRAVDTLVVEVLPDRGQSTVDVNTQADLGGFLFASMLPFLSGIQQIEAVQTEARAENVKNPIEVVLAIDASQSMDKALDGGYASRWFGIPNRMEIVKQAANDLVAILDPNEDNRVAIGIVPWHILVRLDETARLDWDSQGWAEYPSSRYYGATYACDPEGSCTALAEDQALPADPGEEWQGCLDEHRVSLGGHADLPPVADLLDHPSESAFAQAIFPALQGAAYECLRPPVPANFRYQSCYGTEDTDVSRVYGGTFPQRGCDTEGYNENTPSILPLTSDRAAIEAAIDSLEPAGFRTYSTLGVAWGQRLLSHAWSDVWGSSDHPVDPEDRANAGTRKAIVLLTDGEDNPCGLHDPTCSTNDVGFVRSVACTAAKAAGTEIFVIAAMHPDNVPGSLGTALRACSSEADDPDGTYAFLNNADAESLRAAFAEIANQLVTVRRVF